MPHGGDAVLCLVKTAKDQEEQKLRHDGENGQSWVLLKRMLNQTKTRQRWTVFAIRIMGSFYPELLQIVPTGLFILREGVEVTVLSYPPSLSMSSSPCALEFKISYFLPFSMERENKQVITHLASARPWDLKRLPC